MHDELRMHKLSTLAKGANHGRCVMVKDILEALQALQSTPIPTILVVAGIVFLLLSVAGQLTGGIAVHPERQRQATIIGCLLLVVGIALNIGPSLLTRPKDPQVPPVPPPSPRPETRGPSPSPQPPPISPPPPVSPDPGQAFPTKYAGVMGHITRFGPSGAFITVEITLKHGGKKPFLICSLLQNARLSDQDTGDSWEPVDTGGSLSKRCVFFEPSHETGSWMQFKIPDPDKRVFLLNSDLFNRPVENLVLGKPP
jgi:hypothetical protein